MSNFLAVATVTAALKVQIEEAAVPVVSGAKVRMGRPEAPANSDPFIDLFLYQVTPNAALRNDDLPTRRADGTLLQRPRAALDLHYLLSFRGDDAAFEPQRLLGTTVQTLNASTVLDDVAIAKGIALSGLLAGSDLAQAVESVKVTPLSLSLEELSKLWSVFFQVPYNLSVAYLATVVTIEGTETAQRALPVLDRRLYVVPFQNAFIEEVEPASGPGHPILAGMPGDALVLKGRQLRRDVTRVAVRGVTVDPSSVSDTEVRVALTVPPFPAGTLRAGVQGVSVVHPLPMGAAAPPVEHPGFESNMAAFVLRPRITSAAAPTSTLVNVGLVPGLAKGQRAVLFLNGAPPTPPAAFAFPNPPAVADTSTVSFTIKGVAAGDYFVRVQVEGAESPWDPVAGPKVAIP
jgi:hypothetical protein